MTNISKAPFLTRAPCAFTVIYIHNLQDKVYKWCRHIESSIHTWKHSLEHTHTHIHTHTHTHTHTTHNTHTHTHTHTHQSALCWKKVGLECCFKGWGWPGKSDILWKCVPPECWSRERAFTVWLSVCHGGNVAESFPPDIQQLVFHTVGILGSILAWPRLTSVLSLLLLVWWGHRTECLVPRVRSLCCDFCLECGAR